MQTLPDTGARTDFETGAKRDASVGKGIPSEIPPEFIRALAVRLEAGAVKYDRGNWRKGIPLSRYYDALQRHAMQAAEGDTSEDHFGAMAFNVMGWLHTFNQIKAGRLPASLNDLPFHIDNQTESKPSELDRAATEAGNEAEAKRPVLAGNWRVLGDDFGRCAECGIQLPAAATRVGNRCKGCFLTSA